MPSNVELSNSHQSCDRVRHTYQLLCREALPDVLFPPVPAVLEAGLQPQQLQGHEDGGQRDVSRLMLQAQQGLVAAIHSHSRQPSVLSTERQLQNHYRHTNDCLLQHLKPCI